MTFESIIQELGFTYNEAKVYLALLELGLVTAGKIAEKSHVHRANVYDALQKLIDKSAVSYVSKDSKKYYQVTDPKNLHRTIEHKQVQLDSIMPELEEIYNSTKEGKSETSIVMGVKGFQRLLYSLLDFKDDILIYGLPRFAPERVKYFINHFHAERRAKCITMKHIYNENAKDRIAYLNDLDYTEAKYLPQEYDTTISTMICGDMVVLTFWDDKDLKNICILDKDVAETYRNYFYALYKLAKV